MHRAGSRRCECLLRSRVDGVLRTGVLRWICACVHDRICSRSVSGELQQRLVSRLLVGPRGHSCLGFAHDLRRIVSVCLGRELRSRLLQLLDLFNRLRTMQFMFDLHYRLRTFLLDMRKLRADLLDMHSQLCSVDLLQLLGRACRNSNVLHGPSTRLFVVPS